MKNILIVAFLIGSAFSVYSQMILSSGSQIVINSGSSIVTNDLTNSGGTITVNGELSLKGNIINNSGGLFHNSSSGTLNLNGTSQQEITGSATTQFYGIVNINNTNGIALTNTSTGNDQVINGALSFTNGKLILNDFNLTIGSTAPTGISSTKYIVTNSTGLLKRTVSSADVLFPIGNSAYNPVIINNSGTSDTYSVKVNDAKPASFPGTSHIVNRSWEISETTVEGSNLTITTQWNDNEELGTFDETKSCIGVTSDDGENVSWGSGAAAIGSNPYTRNISNVTSLGKFMVTDYFYGGIVVDFKVILAAAWNTSTNEMNKTLNTANLIPLTDPYGLGTTVSSIPADAVDWVKIELRDAADNTNILHTFARLIDQDGQIIEPDISNYKITEVDLGSYYVGIKHRNHLGIVSSSTVDLSVSSPVVNFKSAQSVAWQNSSISTNAAMKDVGDGVFALWQGDANGDAAVSYNGAGSDRLSLLNALSAIPGAVLSSVYNINDVNMDGDVNYNGAGNDRISILNVLNAVPGGTYNEHLPE
jgi:hypothetical protein